MFYNPIWAAIPYSAITLKSPSNKGDGATLHPPYWYWGLQNADGYGKSIGLKEGMGYNLSWAKPLTPLKIECLPS